MKILSAEQIRRIDKLTIEKEPIRSIDLMERAGTQLVSAILESPFYLKNGVVVFCGPGNNGGDGLVVARLLRQVEEDVKVVLSSGANRSDDNQINLDRLRLDTPSVEIHAFTDFDFANLSRGVLCIDAILGTGTNRPVEGELATIIDRINNLPNKVMAIDVPSGLSTDGPSSGPIIKAEEVLTLQVPKLSFFMSDSEAFIHDLRVIDIGLHKPSINAEVSDIHLVQREMASGLLTRRSKFSHKGDYGHALLICGSYGKAGAAILAAKAAMRSGLALVTCHLPRKLVPIMQTSFPEAMVQSDSDPEVFTSIHNIQSYSAIGIGCGLGTNQKSAHALSNLLDQCTYPIVLDADALNLLATNVELWEKIPPNSILTPHPGEFRRLAGDYSDSWDEWEMQKKLALKHQVIIVLKGAHTKIVASDGRTLINSTGNPGMATAGSGDVLTGIITGLLGRGYRPEHAACLGVFLHGSSGDLAAKNVGQESLIASDVIKYLPQAFMALEE